jgi:hypothetical protein
VKKGGIAMNTEFKRYIIEEISKMPFYHVSPNGINHTIKCPYCNDDSPRHGHFCIKADIDSDEPVLYNCLKCAQGGIMNQTVLADIGVYLPQNLAAQMRKSNKIFARKNNLTNMSVMPFKIPEVCNMISIVDAQHKMDYINKRLGSDLTIADAPKYNIIVSLKDFMAENKIESIEGFTPNYISFIDSNYIGFVSTNKNCIIFRRITSNSYRDGTKSHSHRYIKMVIDRKNIDPNTFYTIPTSFDIMGTTPINVHIAEGPFDILSVAINNVFNTEENNMFFAVCGFGYAGVIRNVIKMGVCPHINLVIYADNDKSDSEIKRMILPKKLGIIEYVDTLTIVRNSWENEKDFGVPMDRIKPSYKKLQIYK